MTCIIPLFRYNINMEKIRINKYLANMGVGSRRSVDKLISEKKVKVNGKISQPGEKIDPQKDRVSVDELEVKTDSDKVYIILNKPKGVISTSEDEFNRKTVLDLVKSKVRLYPVGRLDENSTGLILLTNDGELTFRLTHPKFETPKVYELLIQGKITETQLDKLRTGVKIKERKTAPAQVEIVGEHDNRTILNMTIHEGWYHQIRRMCAALNIDLIELKRLSMGSLELGDLPVGKYRNLSSEEIKILKQNK